MAAQALALLVSSFSIPSPSSDAGLMYPQGEDTPAATKTTKKRPARKDRMITRAEQEQVGDLRKFGKAFEGLDMTLEGPKTKEEKKAYQEHLAREKDERRLQEKAVTVAKDMTNLTIEEVQAENSQAEEL